MLACQSTVVCGRENVAAYKAQFSHLEHARGRTNDSIEGHIKKMHEDFTDENDYHANAALYAERAKYRAWTDQERRKVAEIRNNFPTAKWREQLDMFNSWPGAGIGRTLEQYKGFARQNS